jgi:hypothetical protein
MREATGGFFAHRASSRAFVARRSAGVLSAHLDSWLSAAAAMKPVFAPILAPVISHVPRRALPSPSVSPLAAAVAAVEVEAVGRAGHRAASPIRRVSPALVSAWAPASVIR